MGDDQICFELHIVRLTSAVSGQCRATLADAMLTRETSQPMTSWAKRPNRQPRVAAAFPRYAWVFPFQRGGP
jgi:hypothetical protein